MEFNCLVQSCRIHSYWFLSQARWESQSKTLGSSGYIYQRTIPGKWLTIDLCILNLIYFEYVWWFGARCFGFSRIPLILQRNPAIAPIDTGIYSTKLLQTFFIHHHTSIYYVSTRSPDFWSIKHTWRNVMLCLLVFMHDCDSERQMW